MSQSPTQMLIPATQTYSKIEPAFTSCSNGDWVIPVAWGAISRVVGGCQEYRGDSGQCLGAFKSRDVDTRDTMWSCINQENQMVDVCKAGNAQPSKQGNIPMGPGPQLPSFPSQSPPSSLPPSSSSSPPMARSLAALHASINQQKQSTKPTTQTVPLQQQQQPHSQQQPPYVNGTNPAMSKSVFDPAFLVRGKQSSSDPAGYLEGLWTYRNIRQVADESSKLPNEPWSSASSYGSYSLAPNATLSGNSTGAINDFNSTCGSNCMQGDYTMSIAQARRSA